MKLNDVNTIARILDLTERRVRQLKADGIIEEYKGTPGLYELVPTVQSYINYLRKRNPESGENIDYNTERAKLIRAKRLNEEYDLRQKEGDLHTSADIENVLTVMLINFKSRLSSIPAKLAPIRNKGRLNQLIFNIFLEASVNNFANAKGRLNRNIQLLSHSTSFLQIGYIGKVLAGVFLNSVNHTNTLPWRSKLDFYAFMCVP